MPQLSVGSGLSGGRGSALAGFAGFGGAGGVLEALRISIPSCSLLMTMWDDPLPTLPLAFASRSSLLTLSSGNSD